MRSFDHITTDGLKSNVIFEFCAPVSFLPDPNVITLRSGLCYRKSVCLSVCLSVVCNVRAPYSEGWTFRQYFFTVVYLYTLAILWLSRKILRRLSQGNPSVGALNARGVANRAILDLSKAISHKRYKIGLWTRVQLMTNRNDTWGIQWCNFQWPWPIRNPDFKVIGAFRRQWHRNRAKYRTQSAYFMNGQTIQTI